MKLLFSALFAAATLLAGLSADEDGQSRLGDVGSIISRSVFDEMFKHRGDSACTGKDIFTYDAFIAAAKSYPAFGATGDVGTRRREIAAFLGQTSQETSGGWDTAPDGRYAWGYCFVEEINPPWNYCVDNSRWPCVSGKSYHGRGPIQLSYNYNYGQAEQSLGLDLLSNPELVAKDAIVSFKTAFWFWMTPQPPKPSCHDVITGQWTPTQADLAAGRVPGYGVITNIINGGVECGKGYGVPPQVGYRIGFYKRYCDMLGVTNIGDNLDCYYQTPFGQGSTLAMVTELKSFRKSMLTR